MVEMTFVIDRVINAANPSENSVEATQQDEFNVNQDYKECTLCLGIINDDTLKLFGPGKQLKVTIEGI